MRGTVCARRVLTTLRRAEYAELIGLFFLLGSALAMWFVPLCSVLQAHGLAQIRPYAFAVSAVAAFVSPLLFGAMADRHASPVKVLRWLGFATALAMVAASTAIRYGAGPWVVLALIQLHAFCSAPIWSIASTIIFSRLDDAKKQFGPVRAVATVGWMSGCVFVSLIGADRSTLAGYAGAATWVAVSLFTFKLPELVIPKSLEALSWTQRLGLDALTLLKHPDHRVVFLTGALFTIPLAALYVYTPMHMQELGLVHTTAWMSVGQISEVVVMLSLGALIGRWRLKWILGCGLALGVVRYGLSSWATPPALIAGITLHGASFALVTITEQIYLDQRVDHAWRARAQALMALLNSGLGNMVGYLGSGLWFAHCSSEGRTQWPMFWGGLGVAMMAVLIFFLAMYRGRNRAGASMH